ncbi:sugar porter family MFS transporter [Emticicia sp. CRIBPO]|uniref:sugar porter family MFS transporter n=1 Tax=Emticicia sp. CRIBPO TaxID=2683258 RepID=UPI0014120ECB|nr:sugar porter family MFS transporter [Emticicia sp. CRIBPO]NBA89195.1 sugar porter family MFS transporter [Emticicia sp. CRIBPO]
MSSTQNRKYVYKATLVAAVGGLLFGYDTAVIAGAIGFLQIKFNLSAVMTGWVASCALLGCIAGAMFAGALSDRFGRKKILILSAVLFAVSSAGIVVPAGLNSFVFFRIIGGLGIGVASMLAPMYITEIAPAEQRGRLVSINQLGIVSGILLIYFVNAWIAGWHDEAWNVETGWRYMFGSGVIPSAVFFVLLFSVPESPRWLAQQGQHDNALAILIRINGKEKASKELIGIQHELDTQQPGSLAEILKPGLRKALFIGIVLAMFSQVTGINAIMYYAPEIFKSTGDGSSSALLQTVLVGVVNFLFTLVAIKYVDQSGRKKLLLAGSGGMAVCLAVIGSAFHFEMAQGYLVLISILAYIAFFALSLGPLTFVVVAEIFPNRVRGLAMSICIFVLWMCVFMVSQFFPVLLESIGSARTFWIFMILSILAFIFVWLAVPETKGKSLEDMEKIWS